MGYDRDQIVALVQPVVESLGMELADLEYAGGGRKGILRITIDRSGGPENSVSLRDCEEVSRQVSALLDVEDPIPATFTLEVSSPGLDRPLKKIEDFIRFAGRRVKIKAAHPIQNQKVFEAWIQGVTEGDVCVRLKGEEVLAIPYTEIVEARLVVEF